MITCENVAVPFDWNDAEDRPFTCSNCGAQAKEDNAVIYMFRTGVDADGVLYNIEAWVPWRYCPFCGCKVAFPAEVVFP
ncbi:MAG: hypothetical protein IKF14_05840 [Atopobiaceae bacterium]|nr:hypothetical protein [Atopobiaceae bacterium]